MKLRKKVLASALVAGLAMGVAGQASASVYAGSALNLSNLTISFFDSTGALITNLQPSYTFNVENSATLNGVTQASAAGCNSLLNNCSIVSPVLGLNAANAPGSTVQRANDDYSLFAQGTGTYANSNVEITTAQLVQGALIPTSSSQVANAELLGAGQGQASTNIQSSTNWTFSFELPVTATMILSFSANPEMVTDVTLLPPNTAGIAQANMTTDLTLRRQGGNGFVNWAPDGSSTVICASVGLCSAVDGESLNETMAAGPGDSRFEHSLGTGPTLFSLSVAGLNPGSWNLSLAGLTSVSVTQVPEPGTLMLIGFGLLGLGVMAMRRRRSDGLNMA